jgi:hypothetical protein
MKNIITLFETFDKTQMVNDLEELNLYFSDIKDMMGEYYRIRGADGERYQKVINFESKITKGGNFLIDIYCDYLYNYAVLEKVNEIIPELKNNGFKVISKKNVKTSQTIKKKIPTSTGRLSIEFDPVHKISILIKYDGDINESYKLKMGSLIYIKMEI